MQSVEGVLLSSPLDMTKLTEQTNAGLGLWAQCWFQLTASRPKQPLLPFGRRYPVHAKMRLHHWECGYDWPL